MEPPSKRLRLDRADDTDDEDNQDELSMTPAQFNAIQDPMYQLDKKRAKAATRLKSTFEDIFEKYGKDFDGDDDVINLYTDEIEVDNGHVQSLAKQKDGVAEDSLSSDEEARILSGRSRRRGPKSPKSSKSLIPARRTKHNPNQGPQFHSPWNEPPGLGTYRLSSLAFSSPYGAHPPFDFGRSAFGNGPIDPVWQTPDLPIQLPYHQHGSLIGLGGSQFGSIGAQPHPATKRLVNAKSFLLWDASTSSGATNGNVEEEEDEILLGEDGQDKSPFSHQRGPEKATLAAPSKAISYQSSRSTGQVPSPHETSLTKNKLHKKPNGPRKKLARDGAMELTVSGIVLPTHQTAGENVQHQAANSSHPRKRGRPKKLDSYKPATPPHEESGTETRTLQPNERRIEVVIPTMKYLFSTETDSEWANQESAVAADKNTHELGIRPGLPVNEDTETTHLNDNLHSSQSISSHDDAMSYNPFTELTEDPQKNVDSTHPIQTTEGLSASKSSESQDLQESLSKQTHELVDTSISHSLLRCEKDLEIAGIEVSQESEPPQTVVDGPIATAGTDGLAEMGQKPNCDDENDEGDSGRRPSSAADVGVDGKQEAQEMCMGEGVEVMLIDEHNIEATPAPSPLLTDELCGGVVGNKSESNPTTTETAVSETVILQAMDNVPYENNHDSGDEPDPPPTSSNGDEILAVSLAVTSSMAVQYRDQQSEDVPRSSGNPVSHENRISISGQDVGSRNLEHSANHETMESDFPPDQDHLSSSHKATSFTEDEQDASNKSSFASVLVAEIDGLQLDSGRLDGQRSPSLGATDLTDQDLSVFPTSSDVRFTSELVLRLSARITQPDDQQYTGIGRSPSPELGTPIRPEITSGIASQTKGSPTPTTPTRRRGRKSTKLQSSRHRTPSRKRFPLTSLMPGGIDDESEDELSIASSFSSTRSGFYSPFSRVGANEDHDLPPLLPTPRKTTRKYSLFTGSTSTAQTPNRTPGLDRSKNVPPATDSRTGRSQTRRGRNRAVHSSPLARTVAERLLSSPTKRHRAIPIQSPSLVASPHGTLRRCGEGGFSCERDFCLTCCK